MTNDPLEGPKLKVERAKRHFRELEAEITAFKADNPYRVAFEDYIEGGENRVKAVVRDVKCAPANFAAIIGDVAHNLRAALDLLATALAKANGHTSKTALKGTYFPTGADRKGFETEAARKIDRLASAAQRFIHRLQPYPGGRNAAIRALHDIDVDDKHTVLVTVGALLLNDDFTFWVQAPSHNSQMVEAEIRPHMVRSKTPLEDGDEILSFSRTKNTPAHVHVNPTFEVAFGKAQVFDGEPVIPTLHQLIELIERVIGIAERRFFMPPT